MGLVPEFLCSSSTEVLDWPEEETGRCLVGCPMRFLGVALSLEYVSWKKESLRLRTAVLYDMEAAASRCKSVSVVKLML